MALETPATVTGKSASSPTATDLDLAAILPLVRIREGFLVELFAIYRDSLILWRGPRYPEIAEGDLDANDPDKLMQKLPRARRFLLQEISKITLVPPGDSRLADYWWRVLVHHPKKRFEVKLLHDDGPNIAQYFSQQQAVPVTNDRKLFAHMRRRLRTALICLMWAIGVFAAILLGVALLPPDARSILGILAASIFVMFFIAVSFCVLLPVHSFMVNGPIVASKKKMSKGKRQFNRNSEAKSRTRFSPFLGWTLKLLGVLWVLFCVFLIEEQSWFKYLQYEVPSQIRAINLLIYFPALFLLYKGYQLCVVKIGEPTGPSTKQEILFLRRFADDECITLQPTSKLAHWCGLIGGPTDSASSATRGGRYTAHRSFLWNLHPIRLIRLFFNSSTDTAEEAITKFFQKFGKVVAMGNPSENVPTPGATRIYLSDESWQKEVLEKLRSAQVVILQPGEGLGIGWETTMTLEFTLPHRILLSMAGLWKNPNEFEKFLLNIPPRIRKIFPRSIPFRRRPAFVYFERDWTPRVQDVCWRSPLFWPITANAVDLEYTLWPFIQGIYGGDREEPRLPKQYRSQTVLLWVLLLCFVGVVAWNLVQEKEAFNRSEAGRSRAATRSPEENFRKAVLASPVLEYRGREVNYSISLPAAWIKKETSPELPKVDHYFALESHGPYIECASTKERTIIEDFPKERMRILQDALAGWELELEGFNLVQVQGRDWLETRIKSIKDKHVFRERSRLFSDSRGTVLIVATSTRDDPFRSSLIDSVLNSVVVNEGV